MVSITRAVKNIKIIDLVSKIFRKTNISPARTGANQGIRNKMLVGSK